MDTSSIQDFKTPQPKESSSFTGKDPKKFTHMLEQLEKEEREKEELPLEVDVPAASPFQVMSGQSTTKTAPLESAGVREMLAHMVKTVTFTEKEQIKATHFVIQTKTLNEIEIVIDHYSTAPNSFNIEIRGTEMVQKLVIQHKEALQTALQKTLPTFHCNILPPVYATEQRKFNDRKKAIEKSKLFRYGADQEEILGHASK